MLEKWRDIRGYEGLYKVSTLGRVWSYPKTGSGGHNGKILSGGVSATGYINVLLHKNSKKKTHTVHRLVAETFLANYEDKPTVNHIDGNKANNIIYNLEWNTYKENCDHAYKILKRKRFYSKEHSRSKIVNQYDLKGNFIKQWNSTMDIQRGLGIDNGSISAVCRGKYKQMNGFIFKYI